MYDSLEENSYTEAYNKTNSQETNKKNGIVKRSDIHVIRASKGRRENDQSSVNLKQDEHQGTPRYTIVKLLKANNKEKILYVIRVKKDLIFTGKTIRPTADFAIERKEARQWNDSFKVMQNFDKVSRNAGGRASIKAMRAGENLSQCFRILAINQRLGIIQGAFICLYF